jgi:chromosome segregation ATPase
MQAVTKLEESFNQALAKLDAAAGNDDMAAENAKLSKRISDLEAVLVNKDKKIRGLREKANDITVREQDAVKQVAEFQKAETDTQKEIIKLQAAVKDAATTKADALKQVDTLKGQMKEASAGQVNLSDVADLNAKIAQLKEKSQQGNTKLEEYTTRVRALRGSLRQIRAGLKDQVVNAQDVNTAMQAELEALYVQRETDLAEVNIILEKLTPLVEGK